MTLDQRLGGLVVFIIFVCLAGVIIYNMPVPDSQRISSFFVVAILAGVHRGHIPIAIRVLSVLLLIAWIAQEWVLGFWGIYPELRLHCPLILLNPAAYIGMDGTLRIYLYRPRAFPALAAICVIGVVAYLLPYALATPVYHPPPCISLVAACNSYGLGWYEYYLDGHFAGYISVALVVMTVIFDRWIIKRVVATAPDEQTM